MLFSWVRAVQAVHYHFRFHSRIIQIGCHWGEGGHTELYLLEGDTLALVDTGVADTPSRYVVPALAACGYQPSDIGLILNTHGHFDHAGGNGEMIDLARNPAQEGGAGPRVFAHAADVRTIEDVDYQFETFFADNDRLIGRADRLDAALRKLRADAGRPTKVDRALADGELLDLGRGLRLRVVSTPGHTLGSVAYYWEAEGLALVGDTVMGLGARLNGLPLIYYPEQYLATIDLLLGLDPRVLGLGHHYRTGAVPADSIHFGAAVAAYLRASREISEMIGEATARALDANSGADFLAVARAATADLSARLHFTPAADGLAAAGGVPAIAAQWRRLT